MKKVGTLFLLLVCFESLYAQNPFEQFGDTSKILTMTNGRFNEFHDQDSIVPIGSILLDVQRRVIVGYIKTDTSEYTPSPTIISRWWAIDPLSEKYYDMSPYNFVANNPILYVDHNGDSISLHDNGQGGIPVFQNIVSQGSGGFYRADVNATTGIVSMVATGQQGTITNEQQRFVNELTAVTTANGVATINVGNNSEQMIIGDIANRAMDVGDMQKLGTDGKVTAQKALVHEMRENYNVQVSGQSTVQAHMAASNAENRIGGAISSPLGRYITPNPNNRDHGTLVVPIIAPSDQKGTVTIRLYKNNIMLVTGNSRTPILGPLPRR